MKTNQIKQAMSKILAHRNINHWLADSGLYILTVKKQIINCNLLE